MQEVFMKIGISEDIIEDLCLTDSIGYYPRQLVSKGHEILVVVNSSVYDYREMVSGQVRTRPLVGENLTIYITSESSKPVFPGAPVKIVLIFPTQVSNWWDIYNHLWYEV
ncbi:MAG: hypothetical protein A3A90_00555 [Candidatus Zambryskibacteria bacterium RIFCSPLOWO2_01_FULL_35_19]|uniref:Uncharacterized protein n=1 Tax=Candidatus Zambryskibacteria bacterium RIFCSPLOWO2_01_FULL_35_19 TaxID=1802757 RepID=A0A1G2TYR7_9BACT|nr:MAG: hypothetical protein A2726_02390 [Candidatus Zambryskibacteria bacterium RIFCSPHIGHO2_01_FULL_35_32]OHB02279.1 MAG: hypothetical protein A3A90_00555 [Candidatus Zambryskibacteria bacterium RIFCSPLOWO2_01_FULL_35_19]